MPFSIEQHPDLPAILVTQSGSRFLQEMPEAAFHLVRLLETQPGPVEIIYDALGLSLSLDDLMAVAILAPRGPHSWAQHKNARGFIVVTTDPMIRMSAEGMDDSRPGQKRVRVCDTLDQALALLEPLPELDMA